MEAVSIFFYILPSLVSDVIEWMDSIYVVAETKKKAVVVREDGHHWSVLDLS